MRKKTIAIIAVPVVLMAITVGILFSIPAMYYGNMFLVVALHIKPTEQQIVGKYKASTDIGDAYLVVNADHAFTETVQPKNSSPRTVSGSWKPTHFSDSVGFETQFFPFVGVLHDKFVAYVYGTPVFEKSVIG